MSTALALREQTPSLAELAVTIRHEHEQCLLAALSSLDHAIRCGDALLAARERVPRGEWEPWLDTNCPAIATQARHYMRIAYYKDAIPAEARTAIEAARSLRGLPAFDGTGPAKHPPEVRDAALRLVAEGLSRRMVASALGIDRKAVDRWAKGTSPKRPGGYRTGRPSLEQQRERAEAVRRAKKQVGPAALISRFKAVIEANRAGDIGHLVGSLRDLAAAATSWANQLERRS